MKMKIISDPTAFKKLEPYFDDHLIILKSRIKPNGDKERPASDE